MMLGVLWGWLSRSLRDLATERQDWERSLITELRSQAITMCTPFEVLGRHPNGGNPADSYRVCEAGTMVCSNIAEVTF